LLIEDCRFLIDRTTRIANKSTIENRQSTTSQQSKIPKSTIQQPVDPIVEIEHIDTSGDGIARIGRQRVSIPFTIPGERVRVRLAPTRGGAITGTLLEIIRPSPYRVRPRCRHFAPRSGPACGGCSWQHIAYGEQLRLKTDLLTRLVREAVPGAPVAQPMLPATDLDDPWQYRHKVHFVFSAAVGRSNGLAMGHYARGSRHVVPVVECPVHDDRGNRVAFDLREACVRTGAGRTLKSVAVRVGRSTSETMATLIVTGTNEKRLRTATAAVLDGDAAPSSLHLNVHPKGDAFIFGRETRRLSGPARLREELAGVSFVISPTGFFQTNVRAAEILVQLVLAAVPDGAAVLDLYAGAGLFALPLARRGHMVVAVEESAIAVADGIASRDLTRIPGERCRFIAAPVERALGQAPRRTPSRGAAHPPRLPRLPQVDAIVLDPPREGCDRLVLNAVFGEMKPDGAVYVSCNPEALARDLAIITRHGYAVRSIQPVDMFPHTPHIEAVVVLGRRN